MILILVDIHFGKLGEGAIRPKNLTGKGAPFLGIRPTGVKKRRGQGEGNFSKLGRLLGDILSGLFAVPKPQGYLHSILGQGLLLEHHFLRKTSAIIVEFTGSIRPFSVIIPLIKPAGVTSKAGLYTSTPCGAVCFP